MRKRQLKGLIATALLCNIDKDFELNNFTKTDYFLPVNMKHVSILLLEQVNLAGMENARQGLLEANAFLQQHGKAPYFDVQVVGVSAGVSLHKGLYSIQPEALIADIQKTDIILIPPVQQELGEAMQKNAAFYAWIRTQHAAGAEVVSLCLGAFILASTGLLNERPCVTHWKANAAFNSLFPKVNLLSDKLLTDQDGLYTGGGAFSSVNLILYLIEKHIGRECAVYCSKIFQVDRGRQSQSPFIIFKGQKDHADEEVKKVQLFIEENFHVPISIEQLSADVSLGRRTLERRFRKATANSPLEYLQRVRIEAAKKLLEEGYKTINEVMYEVGYNDAKSFRELFKKMTGLKPIDYRMKFSLIAG